MEEMVQFEDRKMVDGPIWGQENQFPNGFADKSNSLPFADANKNWNRKARQSSWFRVEGRTAKFGVADIQLALADIEFDIVGIEFAITDIEFDIVALRSPHDSNGTWGGGSNTTYGVVPVHFQENGLYNHQTLNHTCVYQHFT